MLIAPSLASLDGWRHPLNFVHIAKNGGSSISVALEEAGLGDAVVMHRPSMPKACNSTIAVRNNRTGHALTINHCVETYAPWWARRDANDTFFCVLRHPLDRAVSTFEWAMRTYPTARFRERRKRRQREKIACDKQLLHDWWVHTRAHGHVDNHDLPQSAFLRFCNAPLCKVDQAYLLVRRLTGRPLKPEHKNMSPINKRCHSSDLLNETAALLRELYADDIAAFRRLCPAQWKNKERERLHPKPRKPPRGGEAMVGGYRGPTAVRIREINLRRSWRAVKPHWVDPWGDFPRQISRKL